MPADQIIVIRHAQKPTRSPRRDGVRDDGTPDRFSLTVRGWQHAGALAAVFATAGDGAVDPLAPRPDVIFAAGPGRRTTGVGGRRETVGSRSRRPLQTVTPMAAALGLTPIVDHAKGEERALVADAMGRDGVVLICWQHTQIPAIGNLILGDDTTAPQTWPKRSFDRIWYFDRAGARWTFRQATHGRLSPS